MASAAGPSSALFSSSITSRRFPALRALTQDDVEVMALPPKPTPERRAAKAAATTSVRERLFDPDLVKPSAVSNLSPMASVRAGVGAGGSLEGSADAMPKKKKAAKPLADRPPFRPNNPTQAREAITLEKTGYVGMHSPFDMGYRQRARAA